MGNPVVHFEIMGKDEKKLEKFYSEAFGWELHPAMEGYSMVHAGDGAGIGGGIGKDDRPAVRFYIDVEDVEAALAKVEKLGGKVVVPVQKTPQVTFARFADPEGNVIGLSKM
jgi:predicted enzyme related to lactoylglutathione lyase